MGARQEFARITAGIGVARGKRIEHRFLLNPAWAQLLEGLGVRVAGWSVGL